MPTFNVLIATVGRPTLQRMLDSLSPMLTKSDCLTLVFDGHSVAPEFNMQAFRCKIIIHCEPKCLGSWGHIIRNRYAALLEPRDFIMHADDDDVYIEGTFDKLRRSCNDVNTLYICKFKLGTRLIPSNTNIIRGNIGTPCGIIPFELNKKKQFTSLVGGDAEFYIELAKITTPRFLDLVIYIVRPG